MLVPSLARPPEPEITPANVVEPVPVPTVSVLAFRFTAEVVLPVSEATAWLKAPPRTRVADPLPV